MPCCLGSLAFTAAHSLYRWSQPGEPVLPSDLDPRRHVLLAVPQPPMRNTRSSWDLHPHCRGLLARLSQTLWNACCPQSLAPTAVHDSCRSREWMLLSGLGLHSCVLPAPCQQALRDSTLHWDLGLSPADTWTQDIYWPFRDIPYLLDLILRLIFSS